MGDVEEPQFTSLAARIASLNQQHASQTPSTKRPPITARSKTVNNPTAPTYTNQSNNLPNVDSKRNLMPPPASKKPPPPLPQRKSTQPSPALPPRQSSAESSPALPPRHPSTEPSPALPPRRPSAEPSPALPPRRASTQLTRRDSSESIASTISSMSTLSLTPSHASSGRARAPAYDPSKLPPLPPTKREREQAESEKRAAQAPLVHARSSPIVPQERPTPTPRLPPRRNSAITQQAAIIPIAQRQVKAPRPIQYLSSRVSPEPAQRGAVPPSINLASKPSTNQSRSSYQPAAAVQNSYPSTAGSCLICRDFSGPDNVATLYPRQSNPTIDYLAQVLCGPFPSYTDKARAIFSWLHHNIAYDVAAFFGNNVKNVTPESIITHGAAVCGGYAGLFTAIATKAGMESMVVSGHGKGFGYSALKPGEPIPPENAGHAWNAVRIDGGEWKLIDPCWGAGNVSGESQTYNKAFNPSQFTMSNEDFGLKHFPSDHKSFFRADGSTVSWEDYYVGRGIGEPVQVFGRVTEDGLAEASFEPANKQISVHSNEVIRFQFTRQCPHWDFEKNGSGKPYCMVLAINGLDGRKSDLVPFESNDFYYWLDIYPRNLGCAGQKVPIYAVTSINGVDGRGFSKEYFLSKKGNSGMGFSGIAEWVLI